MIRTAAVVNPHSGGARTLWPSIAAALPGVETRFTNAPGHATALTAELLDAGFDRIIAAGGDGTLNECLNGFFRDGQNIRPSAAIALMPLGTGGDFRKTAGVRNLADAMRVLESGSARPIDIAHIRYHTRDGKPESRYFLNVVSFGMGGDVARRARELAARYSIGGKAAFFAATLDVFFRYRARTVHLTLDGLAASTHAILNIAAGNGRFHGGGMHVCPLARFDDGKLDVTIIDSLTAFELTRDIRYLYSANVYAHPKVHHARAQRMEARSPHQVSIEVDGEPLGVLPVEIEILPAAVRLWL